MKKQIYFSTLLLLIITQSLTAKYTGSSVIQTAGSENYGTGYTVSASTDLNADGINDLVVGESYFNGGTGRVSIYFGGKTINSTPDIIMFGENAGDQFGFSIASGCDLNGDGYGDIVIGAYNYQAEGSGRVYIYFGGRKMNSKADLVLTGNNINDSFGYSVADAGDVNGDGYDDLIVGAYGFSRTQSNAYIYFGASKMDDVADLTLVSESIYQYFGRSVAGAGDVNGDGYADVVVGAYGTKSFMGRTYLYLGGSNMDNVSDVIWEGEVKNSGFGFSVSGAGDINGDGFEDIIVGAPYYNNSTGRVYLFLGGEDIGIEADMILDGENEDDYFGYSEACAGDVNADSYSDIVIGAYNYNSLAGKAYVYCGMKEIKELSGFGIESKEGKYFGYSLSSAGDLNADGYSEVLIGSPEDFSEGKFYIYDFNSSVTDVEEDEIATGYNLFQNYPNPFNPATTIKFSIPDAGNVTLKVYNLLGEEVAVLLNEDMSAGTHQVQFDASELSSGIYLYKLTSGNYTSVKKLMLMK